MIKIDISSYLTEKDAIVKVYTENTHIAWLTKDNKVICFEDIPTNYPRTALFIFNSVKEYLECINNVAWIRDNINEKDYTFLLNLLKHL